MPFRDAAAEIGVSEKHLRRLARANRLPGVVRLGRRELIAKATVEAILRGDVQVCERRRSHT